VAGDPMIAISLTWREVHLAGVVAVARSVDNLARGWKTDTHGLVLDGMGNDIHWLGTVGEMAVAKHLNRYWVTLEPGTVDAGVAEVRAVATAQRRLLLHPDDRDDLPFVKAVVDRTKLPVVTLAGWILGRDGKQVKFWRDPTGAGRYAFFVDNDALQPMSDLRAWLEKHHSEVVG